MRNGALLVVLAVGVGCGGADTGTEWSGSIERVDGLVRVRNPLPADAGAPSFQLVLEQRYGEEFGEGDPEAVLFGLLTGVTVDEQGDVYVLDGGNHEMVAFDANGTVRWAAGREGEGPGEFGLAISIAHDGAGHLYLSNRLGSQIDRWTTEGEYLDTQGLSGFGISQGYVVGLPDPETLVIWSNPLTEGDRCDYPRVRHRRARVAANGALLRPRRSRRRGR